MTFTEKILEQFKTSQSPEHFMSKLQETGLKVYPIIKPKFDEAEFVLVNDDEVAHIVTTGNLQLKNQKVGIKILEKDFKITKEYEWFVKS